MLTFINFFYLILLPILLLICIPKIYMKLTNCMVKSNTCLIGKTVLITGGNAGIGYQTALALAGRGARIIIADINDSTESKNKIIEMTGNTNIATKIFDLSSLESVRKLAEEINSEETRLDILVNNAGIAYSDKTTNDGLSTHMQVNHLGPFLLTHLLTDLLKKSSPSRIIFVSSLLAFINNLTTKNMNEIHNSVYMSYGNTKLCTIICSNMFAEKLKQFNVTCNSVHPGLVTTQIYARPSSDLDKVTIKLMYNLVLPLFGKTVFEGAQCQIHCALSKRLTNVTGKYFVDGIPFIQPYGANDKEFGTKVWRMSEEFVKLKENEKL